MGFLPVQIRRGRFHPFREETYFIGSDRPLSLDTMYRGINATWRLPSRKERDREMSRR